MVVRTLGGVDWEILVANPAPLVIAHLAYHVWAPTLFFNANAAVLADSNMNVRVSPVLILLVNLLFTALPFVRCVQAVEAARLVAFSTDYILAF